jgi:hypothetical protein
MAKATHSHVVDGKTVDCDKPVFGPFGDKALHGSRLQYATAKSDANKRKPEDKLKHDAWCFSYWTPANMGELQAFLKSKPEEVRTLIDAALLTSARQDSWHENRGGTTTTRVSVDGMDPVRLPNAVIDLLKAAGRKVVPVPK